MSAPAWNNNCDKCMEQYLSVPYLLESCASVGIEHGYSTEQMLRKYMRVFHESGHTEASVGIEQKVTPEILRPKKEP